ncbi:MAG TPA: TAXI family TRAP transporter solute-binding subunit [Rhodopila sp.]|jgi:TRAP transporter TAXI family solute receptor
MYRRSLLSALPVAALIGGSRAASSAVVQPVTIGIMGGEIDGTFMRITTDLTSVLNSDDFRVVPIVGKGSVQNMGDLLHLPGVDLALIAADVLAFAQTTHLYPTELVKIQYICKLYDNDMHVCAGPEIQTLADLQGKPVNIDVEGAGTNLTARTVFKTLGIQPDLRTDEPSIGQDKLRHGAIAANVYVAGSPVRLFATQPADTGLHLVPVRSTPELEKTYLPAGQLTHADYPTLIPAGQTVETIGVGVTLAVFGWQPGTIRYRNLVTFVDRFFTRFPDLLKPPHHPKWHDVNLSAEQPGWVRFPPAAAWLAEHRSGGAVASRGADATLKKAQFDQFLTQRGVQHLTPAQRDATWQYFEQERLRSR